MHEAHEHQVNSFVTLTYDNEHLPANGSLNVKHWQDFAKRVRNKIHKEAKEKGLKRDPPFRFFHAGEYGDRYGRPHLHACLFNLDFSSDRTHVQDNAAGDPLYHSETLDALWTQGSTIIGDLTFESAAYVARYVMKKITGEKASAHYEVVDKKTGECTQLKPEYTTMSRRPGIGKAWLEKYKSDVYPSDEVISNGYPAKPPKYYDGQYEIEHPEFMAAIKQARIRKQYKNRANNTPERLAVREAVAKAKCALYSQRKLES